MAEEENPAEIPRDAPQGAPEPTPEGAPAAVEVPAEPEVQPAQESVPPEDAASAADATPVEPGQVTTPPTSSTPEHSARSDAERSIVARKQKVERRLERILAETKKRISITNRDVVKVLRISDATASRYLRLFVSRGQLRKTGGGRSVAYFSASV